jgi:hypothetical protein
MRRFASLLVVVAATTWSADGGVTLDGVWRLDERKAQVRFHEVDGGWDGVIETSERPKEAGFVLFRALHQTNPGELRGTLAMPENGSTHEVVVTVRPDELKAVAGTFIFSKTLVLTRSNPR